MACITLAFEYWWYKYKRNPRIVDVGEGPGPKAAFAKGGNVAAGIKAFQSRNLYPERGGPRRPNNALAGVENSW